MYAEPQAGTPLLAVQGLTVTLPSPWGPAPVLCDVSVTLHRGEILALLGESGCGKSLTCRTIVGLLPPGARVTGGSVTFAGTDLLRVGEAVLNREYRRRIAYVFQDPATYLNPVLTIGEQIAEVAAPTGGVRRRQAVRAAVLKAMAMAELPEPERLLHRYPHELSGGMQQRAMTAMALVRNPEVLIADEITTALDVITQARLLTTIRRLQHELGLSVLLVTHDIGVAAAVAHRIAVMYAGCVVECGPTRAILASPRHPYTRGLLAAVPRPGAGRLSYVPGQVPPYHAAPPGCRFYTRCAEAEERCSMERPPLKEVGAQHGTACIHV